MSKKLLLAVGLVLITAIIALLVLGNIRHSSSHGLVAVSTQPTSTVVGQAASSTASSTAPHVRQPAIWGEYIVNEPNALILVDSQGRRTGKDPNTGTLYHEIPNTSYVEEATSPGHPNGELFVSDLSNGQYTLYVLGGRTGSYALDIASDKNNQAFQGNIQTDWMIAYAQTYDLANLASSTFSFQRTVSSTASITSALPNNLPLQ
jgi:hypothetical protein